jgi:hypothetical protein
MELREWDKLPGPPSDIKSLFHMSIYEFLPLAKTIGRVGNSSLRPRGGIDFHLGKRIYCYIKVDVLYKP